SMMMLSAIMLDSGLDDAKEFLDSIQLILWTVLSWIIEATDHDAFLRALISLLDPATNPNALSVHRTTVTSMIPQADRNQLDEILTEQYKECVEELDEVGAKSSACIMVMDDTHEKVRSKYYNGNYSYVVVGQTSTWQRGFVYPTNFDSSHQLFMGSKHRDYRLIDSEKKGLRPWLLEVKAKVKVARELGIDQVLIEGDRAFFNAELIASANLGLIDPGARPGHMPRVIVPRKFTREKDDFKWKFLLDNTKPQVFIDYINLSPYIHPALKQACASVYRKTSNGQFKVPYICVAMVDEYSSKKKRTLDEVKARARIVHDLIEHESRNLEALIKVYMTINKALNKGKAKEPSFGRGARRKKFTDEKERRAYDACFKTHGCLERWKKEKACLLKTLMFFAISLRPGDDPMANPSMFIEFAKDYHERWGIENGFRDVKARFLSKGRSRQPCMRQFRLVLGMMLYNRWEVERKRTIRAESQEDPEVVLAFFEARAWIRRKHEKECHHLPTAVGFLVQNWCEGILSALEAQMG
nr:hypothetical protein [Candidatus Sigynarchaeota archaeon]